VAVNDRKATGLKGVTTTISFSKPRSLQTPVGCRNVPGIDVGKQKALG